MPYISEDDFKPPWLYRNAHLSTMVPNVLGHVPEVPFQRTRIDTPDDDFLDLDLIQSEHPKIAILCHGLEGSSDSKYIRDFAHALSNNGWDICAMNYRGCSGVMNRQLKMYNSGSTYDLDTVIQYISPDYKQIGLVGVSLGGNLILKYLGEGKFDIPKSIQSAIAISAPVHLDNASKELLKIQNYPYQINFLKPLLSKVSAKAKMYPDQLKKLPWYKTRNLYQFDHVYTAPIHGYRDAFDYYTQCSSRQFLPNIQVPTLLLNAQNDTFLGPLCYPIEEAKNSSYLYLQTPSHGGHVGFAVDRSKQSYMVDKVLNFLDNKTV